MIFLKVGRASRQFWNTLIKICFTILLLLASVFMNEWMRILLFCFLRFSSSSFLPIAPPSLFPLDNNCYYDYYDCNKQLGVAERSENERAKTQRERDKQKYYNITREREREKQNESVCVSCLTEAGSSTWVLEWDLQRVGAPGLFQFTEIFCLQSDSLLNVLFFLDHTLIRDHEWFSLGHSFN